MQGTRARALPRIALHSSVHRISFQGSADVIPRLLGGSEVMPSPLVQSVGLALVFLLHVSYMSIRLMNEFHRSWMGPGASVYMLYFAPAWVLGRDSPWGAQG